MTKEIVAIKKRQYQQWNKSESPSTYHKRSYTSLRGGSVKSRLRKGQSSQEPVKKSLAWEVSRGTIRKPLSSVGRNWGRVCCNAVTEVRSWVDSGETPRARIEQVAFTPADVRIRAWRGSTLQGQSSGTYGDSAQLVSSQLWHCSSCVHLLPPPVIWAIYFTFNFTK